MTTPAANQKMTKVITIRSGSWVYGPRDCPGGCRSAYRDGYGPVIRVSNGGFRVCINNMHRNNVE